MSKFNKCVLAGAIAALFSGGALAAGQIEATSVPFAYEVTGGTGQNPTAETGSITYAVTAPDILIGRSLDTGQITVEATIEGAVLGNGFEAGDISTQTASSVQSLSATPGSNTFQFVVNPPNNTTGFIEADIFTIGSLPLRSATSLQTLGGEVSISFVVKDTTTGTILSTASQTAILNSVRATAYDSEGSNHKIDVYADKKQFVGNTTTADLGTIQVTRADVDSSTPGVQFASAAGSGATGNVAGSGNFRYAANNDEVTLTLNVPQPGAFTGFYAIDEGAACGSQGASDQMQAVAGNPTSFAKTLVIGDPQGETYRLCAVANGTDVIDAQTIGLTAQINLAGNLTIDPPAYTNASFANLSYNGAVEKVWHFNPASNPSQQSYVRVTNTSAVGGLVQFTSICDNGQAAGDGAAEVNVAAGSSILVTSQDLENGNSSKGIAGSIGSCASGKHRLTITGQFPTMRVQNFIRNNTANGIITTNVNNGDVSEGLHEFVDYVRTNMDNID